MTHSFPSVNAIELTQTQSGVTITEVNYPDDNQVVFISKERIAKTIEFLQSTLEALEAGE
jgi:hypothetical protein